MKTLFDSRKLSKDQATAIAESQKDLGGKSQKDMIIALGGARFTGKTYEELIKWRMDAFNRLDPLSQFLVKEFLGNQSIEQSVSSIEYATHNLKSAVESLKQEVE